MTKNKDSKNVKNSKTSKSSKKVIKKTQTRHLLMYVVDSEPKIKEFWSTDELGKFVDDFQKQYPDHLGMDSGNWVDYAVVGVTGEIHFFTTGIELT